MSWAKSTSCSLLHWVLRQQRVLQEVHPGQDGRGWLLCSHSVYALEKGRLGFHWLPWGNLESLSNELVHPLIAVLTSLWSSLLWGESTNCFYALRLQWAELCWRRQNQNNTSSHLLQGFFSTLHCLGAIMCCFWWRKGPCWAWADTFPSPALLCEDHQPLQIWCVPGVCT